MGSMIPLMGSDRYKVSTKLQQSRDPTIDLHEEKT